jgi:hypothetical protein
MKTLAPAWMPAATTVAAPLSRPLSSVPRCHRRAVPGARVPGEVGQGVARHRIVDRDGFRGRLSAYQHANMPPHP